MSQIKKALRIAVDAMGGDHAPGEVIKGAVDASKQGNIEIILVGPMDMLQAELAKYDTSNLPIKCFNADEFVKEGEPPALVLRQKRNASIVVATKLVKAGEADAVLSAGPTGAVVACALTILGSTEGMERPVVGGPMLGFSPNTVVMDYGGNVDCKPYHLLSFAVVGCAYAKKLLHIPNPTVAMLSVGSEEGKGNELVKESFPLFKKSGLNFIGNVEGNDLVAGKVNVIVCDGFVGNILLKFAEGLGGAIVQWLKVNLTGRMPDDALSKLKHDLMMKMVGADLVGGAPLLGVNGVVMVMHGRSQALQFSRAIVQTKVVVESGIVDAINSELAVVRTQLDGEKS